MTTYRTGRSVGRTLYRGDDLIGTLDDPELAARVAALLNADDARRPAGGHEIVVEHDTRRGGSIYTVACHEPPGADCRLVCTVPDCVDSTKILRDVHGPLHLHVSDPDEPAEAVTRHDMRDAGHCNAIEWLENDDAGVNDLAVDDQGVFEIGRFPIKPVWTGDGVEWRRDTPPETVPSGGV